MIGWSSLWPKALFFLVALVFGTALYREWRDLVRQHRPVTGRVIVVSAFVVLWMLSIFQLFTREALFHQELRQLRPEQVESIQIGNDVLADPNSISAIVGELNHARWFEVNHGGWGEEAGFVIHLNSGKRLTYHVARYLRQPGAVLISMSGYDSSGRGMSWNNGVVFCPALPAILTRTGISLPGAKARPIEEKTAPAGWKTKLLPLAIFGFFVIVSLSSLWGMVLGKMEVYSPGSGAPMRPQWLGKLAALPIVTIIAAWSSLRVLYTLFDRPDPTNKALVIAVWLVLLLAAVGVLARRWQSRPRSSDFFVNH